MCIFCTGMDLRSLPFALSTELEQADVSVQFSSGNWFDGKPLTKFITTDAVPVPKKIAQELLSLRQKRSHHRCCYFVDTSDTGGFLVYYKWSYARPQERAHPATLQPFSFKFSGFTCYHKHCDKEFNNQLFLHEDTCRCAECCYETKKVFRNPAAYCFCTHVSSDGQWRFQLQKREDMHSPSFIFTRTKSE